MNRIILLTSIALGLFSSQSFAEACLNTDKKGGDGDPRSYDYVACKPSGVAGGQSYNSVSIIGGQMADIMSRRTKDSGYTDEERAANLRELRAFAANEAKRRAGVTYGALVEMTNDANFVADLIYPNAKISEQQQRAIRSEISTAISAGRLLETYDTRDYTSRDVWKATDPVERWKNCEVATVLSQAYLTGELATPAAIDRNKGYAIASMGASQYCGGTAYWKGRVYEAGDDWVKGIDKELDKTPKSNITWQYDIAIINGYTPAYQRLADLLRLGGPERYRGKKYFDLMDMTRYPYWLKPKNSDERYMMLFQYRRCLATEPANLVCAQQLRELYSNKETDILDGYNSYNADLVAYYDNYVKELQKLLANAAR
ncbi:MAG: hypothetical protein V4607_17120 [Pseudomonadota bacterium]